MTVTDFTFPQNGDEDFAENFGTWLGRSNITDYVEEGMDVSISDASAPEVTITEGKAFVSQDSKTISSNSETRLTLDYCIIRPTVTIDSANNNLTDGDVNDIYLVPNVSSNDSPEYQAQLDTEAAPSANSLRIAQVDLTSDTVSEVNRDIDFSAEEAIFSVNLGIPVYSDTSNAVSGQGNLVFIDGNGSQELGLYIDSGSGYTKVGVDRISDISDVTGITALTEDSEANKPTAGTEGRIYFNSTSYTVEYDDGNSWQVIGIDPAQIGANDLGFDPATQTELNNHTATGDAHHSKTSTLDELSDNDLTDIDVGLQADRPNAGTNGRLYIARDTNRIYYDDGSNWQLVGVESHNDLVNVTSDNHHTRPVPGTNISEDANNNFNLVQGSGSGLDADTLDSVELSDISVGEIDTTSFDNRYVEVSGDVMSGILDLSGNDLEDGTTTIWDASNTYIPQGRLQNDSVTISSGTDLSGGGTISLGGSITLDVDSASIRPSVSDSGTVTVSSPTDINFGSNLQVADDGDGTTTVDAASSTDTTTDISQGGTTVVNQTSDINFTSSGAASVNVSDDGDGTGTVNVDATDTDTTYSAGNALSLSGTEFNVNEGSINHDNLSSINSNDHHNRYSDEEAQDAVGNIAGNGLNYNDSLDILAVAPGEISHNNLGSISSDDHHTKYTDGDVADAVAAGGLFAQVTLTSGGIDTNIQALDSSLVIINDGSSNAQFNPSGSGGLDVRGTVTENASI